MKITINNTDYELNFGFAFLRRLNRMCGVEVKGVNTKHALDTTLPLLITGDLETVADYVIAANDDLTKKLVDQYFESLAVADDDGNAIDEVVNKVIDAVKTGVMTRAPFKRAKEVLDKAQKEETNKD